MLNLLKSIKEYLVQFRVYATKKHDLDYIDIPKLLLDWRIRNI